MCRHIDTVTNHSTVLFYVNTIVTTMPTVHVKTAIETFTKSCALFH